MAEDTTSTCKECGQDDDHPKIYLATEVFHNDCAPARVVALLSGKAAQAREACVAGKRGADLLAHIQQLHEDA